MWVVGINFSSKDQFFGELALKHQVSISGYPTSQWVRDGKLFLISVGFIFGEEQNKRAFKRDLVRQDRCITAEFEGDFGVVTSIQPVSNSHLYHPEIIWTHPAVISKQGYHTWYVGSFRRELLEKLVEESEQFAESKLLYFRREKLTNISLTKVLPNLSKNQKRAVELAINHGYYEYPKKVTMEALAHKMGISYSTFQAHLKKAEGKLLPEVFKQL